MKILQDQVTGFVREKPENEDGLPATSPSSENGGPSHLPTGELSDLAHVPGWVAKDAKLTPVALTAEEWLADRLRLAARMLTDCVEANPRKRSGIPVIKGSRVTLAQVLAELADDHRVSELSDDFEIDVELLRKFLEGLAIYLDQPVQ